MYRRAILDPVFHGKVTGLPLEPFQVDMVRAVERAMANPAAQFVIVRSARQTGKNEVMARAEARFLSRSMLSGGSIVHAAPTFKPQVIRAKQRLERTLKRDPLAKTKAGPRWKTAEGYQFWMGEASVEFYSADKTSNVVGATADAALILDEAHKIDGGKFEEDFAPMVARTAAPVCMFGVAAYQADLLFEYMQKVGTKSAKGEVLNFPASLWAERSKTYRLHYEERRSVLGPTHPVILTQYDLLDLEGTGGLLAADQRDRLFSGAHPFQDAPKGGEIYLAALDIAGESELEGDSLEWERQDRDSTVLLVARVIFDAATRRTGFPLVEIVAGRKWTGEEMPKVQEEVLSELRRWRIRRGITDARGIGEQMAGTLARNYPPMKPYKATAQSAHEDTSAFLAALNHGRISFWSGEDAFHKEAVRQARHVRRKVTGHELLNMEKPSTEKHIDIVKAASYLARLAQIIRPTEAPNL